MHDRRMAIVCTWSVSIPFFRYFSARSAAFGSVFALLSLSAHAEPFIGQFELKTLEAARGLFEFQSQNAWAWDQPPRKVDSGPADAWIFDENTLFRERYALELEVGFSESLKMRVGIEAENERIDEPESPTEADEFSGLSVDEIGAEIVAILVRRETDGFGVGFVAEIEGPFDQKEANHFTLGPIVEYQSGSWLFAAVPMLVYSFGGDAEESEPLDEKWDFGYAAQLMHIFSDRWSLALEGYGTVERLGNSGHPSMAAEYFGDSDQHRVGPVVYFSHEIGNGTRDHTASQMLSSRESDSAELTIGLGLLEGLNSQTADHTLKLSIEVDF
jgi:hypothetical protein